MQSLYPIHLNVSGKSVLVVGGGKVAKRKVGVLVRCGAQVAVVAPAIEDEIRDLGVRCLPREYDPELLTGSVLVFACANDRAVNARVARDATRAGLWCNVADDPDGSHFHVPASHMDGRVCVSVSTTGASPRLAAHLRDTCVAALPNSAGEMAEVLASARATILAHVPAGPARRELLQALVTKESLAMLAEQDQGTWDAWFGKQLRDAAPNQSQASNAGVSRKTGKRPE